MDDAISRKGVSAWLENMGYSYPAKVIMDEKRFPSARPKRGRWIRNGWAITCSECGYDMPYTVRSFCPNCGADMREETT